MPSGFTKSQEGTKEYEKLGLEYPNTVEDSGFDAFERQTKVSPYSNKNTQEVTKMIRLLANDGKEYLVHDQTDRRYDNLGNELKRYRADIGCFPIPIPRRELRLGPNMTQEEIIAEIIKHDVGYSEPFTAGKAEELHKLADDTKQRGATQYYVMKYGGTLITVHSYEDFKEGDFDELQAFGTTADKHVKQQKALLKQQAAIAASTAVAEEPPKAPPVKAESTKATKAKASPA